MRAQYLAAFTIFLELESSFPDSKAGVLPTRLVETREVAQLEVGISNEIFNKHVSGVSRWIPKARDKLTSSL